MADVPPIIAEHRCPQCDTPLMRVVGGWECVLLSTGVGGCGYFTYFIDGSAS